MIKEKKEGCDEEMRSLAGFDRTLLERSGSREDGWISRKSTGRIAVFVCHSEPVSIAPFTHRKNNLCQINLLLALTSDTCGSTGVVELKTGMLDIILKEL